MGARKYGISFRVFNSIAQELDVELNTRRKILYLQATIFIFFITETQEPFIDKKSRLHERVKIKRSTILE